MNRIEIEVEAIQLCGCEAGNCLEILGLEDEIYACFACGYAGVTPSSNEYPKEEIHIGGLYQEVERLRVIEDRYNSIRQMHTEGFCKYNFESDGVEGCWFCEEERLEREEE